MVGIRIWVRDLWAAAMAVVGGNRDDDSGNGGGGKGGGTTGVPTPPVAPAVPISIAYPNSCISATTDAPAPLRSKHGPKAPRGPPPVHLKAVHGPKPPTSKWSKPPTRQQSWPTPASGAAKAAADDLQYKSSIRSSNTSTSTSSTTVTKNSARSSTSFPAPAPATSAARCLQLLNEMSPPSTSSEDEPHEPHEPPFKVARRDNYF